ncbi:MAG: SusD/RagB family nutrient-binding outer membrane lipoprotein [Cyclobacteriaceae bacterium]
MKKSYKYLLSLAVVFLFLASCEEGYDELNTNPVRLTSLDPTFQLNYAIIESAPVYGNLTYETTIVKHMITPFQGVGTGGNLNQDNRSATQANWQDGYRRILKNVIDGIETVEGDPERTNLYNMLRIWRAHAFITLTDTYGEIPYTEASRGYLEGAVIPKDDEQEFI